MTKGLFLARAFYLAGHTVIGLDFEGDGIRLNGRWYGIPSSGKKSRAFSKYIEITKPSSSNEYTRKVMEIITKEEIDCWICVSGVETTTWDAIAKARIEAGGTSCKVFQFEQAICETLDDKYRFIEQAKAIGLDTPKTRRVTSVQEVLDFLGGSEAGSEQYVLKALHVDDVSRADMTKYSRSNMDETRARISRLDISAERPWILQEFVEGEEYCTHSVVVDNCVKAFVCCPSSDLLMHYQASPTHSTPHSAKLLKFTEDFVRGLAKNNKHLTGQLSFDFIVKRSENDLQLYPIECNPRTHTAVVLFGRDTTRLANCYLSLLHDPGLPPPTTEVYIPDTTFAGGFYWIGHDIVSLGFLPLLHFFGRVFSALWKHARRPNDTASETWNSMPLWALIEHLLCWKDAVFEVWDPVPFWMLYHVYWPCVFLLSLLTWKKWSRINVSTTRVFRCN